jgi:hypothetical protein
MLTQRISKLLNVPSFFKNLIQTQKAEGTTTNWSDVPEDYPVPKPEPAKPMTLAPSAVNVAPVSPGRHHREVPETGKRDILKHLTPGESDLVNDWRSTPRKIVPAKSPRPAPKKKRSIDGQPSRAFEPAATGAERPKTNGEWPRKASIEKITKVADKPKQIAPEVASVPAPTTGAKPVKEMLVQKKGPKPAAMEKKKKEVTEPDEWTLVGTRTDGKKSSGNVLFAPIPPSVSAAAAAVSNANANPYKALSADAPPFYPKAAVAKDSQLVKRAKRVTQEKEQEVARKREQALKRQIDEETTASSSPQPVATLLLIVLVAILLLALMALVLLL